MPEAKPTFRELRRFAVRGEAEQVQRRLLDAGIATVIPDQRVMGVHPSCRPGPEDVRLLVAADDFARALAVVTE